MEASEIQKNRPSQTPRPAQTPRKFRKGKKGDTITLPNVTPPDPKLIEGVVKVSREEYAKLILELNNNILKNLGLSRDHTSFSVDQAPEILRDYYQKLSLICSAMPVDSELVLKKVLGLSDQQYQEKVAALLERMPPGFRMMLFSSDFKELTPDKQAGIIALHFIILGSIQDLASLPMSPDDARKVEKTASFIFTTPDTSGFPQSRIVIKRYSDFYKPLVDLSYEKLGTNRAKYTIMAALMHEIAHELVGKDEALPYVVEISFLDDYIQKGLIKLDTNDRSREMREFIDRLSVRAKADSDNDPRVDGALTSLYATLARVTVK